MWLIELPRPIAPRGASVLFYCLLVVFVFCSLASAQVARTWHEDCQNRYSKMVDLQTRIEMLHDLATYFDEATSREQKQEMLAAFVSDAAEETEDRKLQWDAADREFLNAATGKGVSSEMQQIGYRQMLAKDIDLDWNPAWNTDVVKFLRAVTLRRQLMYFYWKDGLKWLRTEIDVTRVDLRRGTIPWLEDNLKQTKQRFADLRCVDTTMLSDKPETPTTGGTASAQTFSASASNNDLASGYPIRGFGDSKEVDVWIPFQVDTGSLSNVTSATFTVRLKPIGQLIGTDGMALKGADGKTYWYKIEFKTENPEWQDFVIDVTDPEVLRAIMNGKLLGVVQDDSAVESIKVKVTFKK